MRRELYLCFPFALMLLTASGLRGAEPFRYKVGEHGKGKLAYVSGAPVLILRGSPKELGEQTGVLAVRQAKPLFNFPREYFLGEYANEILRTNPTWTKQDARFKLTLATAELTFWPQVLKGAARPRLLDDNKIDMTIQTSCSSRRNGRFTSVSPTAPARPRRASSRLWT